MDKIPLINPRLINVVSAKVDKVPVSTLKVPVTILKAEVVSSEPIQSQSNQALNKQSQAQNPQQVQQPESKHNQPQEKQASQNSYSKDQQYRVVLKVAEQTIETVSKESFKKGMLLDVKVNPGPELKILAPTHEKPLDQTSAKAAMQQLLADRIPKIQSTGFNKLIDQLSSLMSGTAAKTPVLSNSAHSPLEKRLASSDSTINLKASTASLSTKQALAQLAYQSLNPVVTKNASTIPGDASATASLSSHSTNSSQLTNASKLNNISAEQQIKNWLQQLPSSKDISTSAGLKNALNNTGIKAEAQLGQLAQQLTDLGKVGHGRSENNGADLKSQLSANSIFQQLQKIQQKIFSSNEAPSTPINPKNLTSALQNTARSLEQSSKVLSELNNASLEPNSNRWQNPLLNNQAYASFNDLLKDPLLQNPSSNNKFALSQILSQLTQQDDSHARIPLNWPARSGNEMTVLRTLQNLLAHIEREQGIQMQQTDSGSSNSLSNNPNQTALQNQQWLPLLMNHHEQFRLIEFFINKEEQANTQGEKKSHWFINLHFELPQLGQLGIEISMFENECNTIFWSESTSTLSQISHHVQPLRQRLTEQGIIVNDVQSRHGTLTKRKQNFEQRLVDIET